MDRRTFLVSTAALSSAALSSAALGGLATAADFGQPLPLKDAAREAWLYGLPLIEVAGVRAKAMLDRPRGGLPANVFVHTRVLAGPESRGVTAPNNDTIYSGAWVDLSGGPVTIHLPATGERYFSLQLLDMYTNAIAILGSRTTGGDGGVFTLVGPTDKGSPGMVRCTTPWVWALARMLIDGPADLAAAHALQDQLTISPARPGRKPPQTAERGAPWADYFASVQTLLIENPPPATDRAFFERVAALGLRPEGGFNAARFTPAQAAEIEAGVADAHVALRRGGAGRVIDGWRYPPQDVGDYGQDYHLRAGVALGGLAALPPAEALYLGAVSPGGRPVFDGDGLWRIHLPDGGPPVDAFWSLTMYEVTPEGQGFLTSNPIDRYSIGNRTPGLKANADGSLDIWVSRTDPGPERHANWLPAPASGPFRISLRNYLPSAALVNGAYHLPPVTLVSPG